MHSNPCRWTSFELLWTIPDSEFQYFIFFFLLDLLFSKERNGKIHNRCSRSVNGAIHFLVQLEWVFKQSSSSCRSRFWHHESSMTHRWSSTGLTICATLKKKKKHLLWILPFSSLLENIKLWSDGHLSRFSIIFRLMLKFHLKSKYALLFGGGVCALWWTGVQA